MEPVTVEFYGGMNKTTEFQFTFMGDPDIQSIHPRVTITEYIYIFLTLLNTSPATCQCLATFTPLKSKMLIFFRDVISLLARVVILLIDTATQEVPMKNI